MLTLPSSTPGVLSPSRTRAAALMAFPLLLAGCALDWDSSKQGKLDADSGLADSDGGLDGSSPADEQDSGAHGNDASVPGHDSGADAAKGEDQDQGDDFCERVPEELCADFEDEGLEAWSWTEVYPESLTAASVVEIADRPGKRVFQSRLTGVKDESARTVQAFPATLTTFHTEFDFKPELNPPADAYVIWFKFTQHSGVDDYPGVSIASSQAGTILMVQAHTASGDSYDEYELPSPPAGWSRVTLNLAFGPSGSASVRYDNGPTWQQAGLALQSTDVKQSFAQYGLYTQGTSQSTALYDDIVASYQE